MVHVAKRVFCGIFKKIQTQTLLHQPVCVCVCAGVGVCNLLNIFTTYFSIYLLLTHTSTMRPENRNDKILPARAAAAAVAEFTQQSGAYIFSISAWERYMVAV